MKFLNYKKYDNFIEDLQNNRVDKEAIVFIQDKRCIWARGVEYNRGEYVDLARVATTGSYNDLIDKPVINDIPDLHEYAKINSVPKLITLTTAQYQALVQQGAIENGVYYFTYEGEEETTSWTFGGTFPVTFSGENIGTFPITLQ